LQLAYTVDEKKIREVFRLAGRCVTIELGRDKVTIFLVVDDLVVLCQFQTQNGDRIFQN
jgi:hypothetical protein